MPDPVSLLRTAYGDLSAVLSSLTTAEGWEPTGCAGWTAVDLGFHLLSDARRASLSRWKPRSTAVQPVQPVGSQHSSTVSDDRTAERSP